MVDLDPHNSPGLGLLQQPAHLPTGQVQAIAHLLLGQLLLVVKLADTQQEVVSIMAGTGHASRLPVGVEQHLR